MCLSRVSNRSRTATRNAQCLGSTSRAANVHGSPVLRSSNAIDKCIAWGLVFVNCNHAWPKHAGSSQCDITRRFFRAKGNGPCTCPLDRPRMCSGGGPHESETETTLLATSANAMSKAMSIAMSRACQKQCSFSFGKTFS
jgi:hypothetical protein